MFTHQPQKGNAMNDEHEIKKPTAKPAKSDPVADLLKGIRTELDSMPAHPAKDSIIQHLNTLRDLVG